MLTLTMLLHYGPHGHGGWHHGLFLFGPGIFWLGLVGLLGLLVATRLSGSTRPAPGRRREGEDHDRRPSAPAEEVADGGPAWPDLYPEPRPRPQPERNDEDFEIL